jgi:hypothetical protein
MIEPTKYKSISVSELKTRVAQATPDTKKAQCNTILSKLMELIILKHS